MSENENVFEYATRHKLLFDSSRGSINVQQLWDVPLRDNGGFNLNEIAKNASKAFKSATEESFVEPARTTANKRLEMTFETVKRVIEVKVGEEKAAKDRAAKKERRAVLTRALAEKQEGALSKLSVKQLQEQLAELEAEDSLSS